MCTIFAISTFLLIVLLFNKDHPVFNDSEYETCFSWLTPTQRWYSLVVLIIIGYISSFFLKTSVKANMETHFKIPTQYDYLKQRESDYLKPDTVERLERYKQKRIKPLSLVEKQRSKQIQRLPSKPNVGNIGGINYSTLPNKPF